jgi:hypothetical protein
MRLADYVFGALTATAVATRSGDQFTIVGRWFGSQRGQARPCTRTRPTATGVSGDAVESGRVTLC